MNWSIIIFCYNERENISKVFEGVLDFLEVKKITDYEIIIVDDGSEDGTKEKLEQITRKYSNVHLVLSNENNGIGHALRTGYAIATKEYICAVPGDNQFEISELKNVKPFSNDVFYSFYRMSLYKSFFRKAIHYFNKMFNKWLLGLDMRDVNWIKVYRREQLNLVEYKLSSSIVESEICAKLMKMGCKPIEISSQYLPRNYGKPKGGTWKTVKLAISEIYSLYKVVSNFDPPRRFE